MSGKKRTFLAIDVSYPKICTYPEYEGKPYYGIKYLEDGETILGFSTYKPEVLSEYLRNYFMPSAEPEPEEFEWCTDCKEYDQEKHCCHRWMKVIRQTVEEVKRQYALEYPKIIHCEDCKFYTAMNRKLKTGICSLTMHHLGDEGFCSDAEMRGDHE